VISTPGQRGDNNICGGEAPGAEYHHATIARLQYSKELYRNRRVREPDKTSLVPDGDTERFHGGECHHPRLHPEDIDVNLNCLDNIHQLRDCFQVQLFDGQQWERNIETLR